MGNCHHYLAELTSGQEREIVAAVALTAYKV